MLILLEHLYLHAPTIHNSEQGISRKGTVHGKRVAMQSIHNATNFQHCFTNDSVWIVHVTKRNKCTQ